jgi:hypothetical protein
MTTGSPRHQAQPLELRDLVQLMHPVRVPDDGDRPAVAVTVELVGLERHNGLVDRGRKMAVRPDRGKDMTAIQSEAHRLHRGQRIAGIDDPAQRCRFQQVQALKHRDRPQIGYGIHNRRSIVSGATFPRDVGPLT